MLTLSSIQSEGSSLPTHISLITTAERKQARANKCFHLEVTCVKFAKASPMATLNSEQAGESDMGSCYKHNTANLCFNNTL